MHEDIASDAALSFSPEAVHLQRRIGSEWQEADHVRFDGGDVGGGLARIRDALRDEAGMPAVLLVIPDDQLLYTRLKVAADAPALMASAVAEALDGLTPYALSDLAFDWLPAAPGEVHVAAVARRTLIEAADFAIRHGFAIRGFIADPDPERFPGEPGFSLAAAGQDPDDESEFLPRIDRHRLQASIERLRALAAAQAGADGNGNAASVAVEPADEDTGPPVIADAAGDDAAVAVAADEASAVKEDAANRVWITPIPPSIPYPVVKDAPGHGDAAKSSNQAQAVTAEDRPAVRVARLGGQSRAAGADEVADGRAARPSGEAVAPIVRHDASPAPEAPALPWLRRHLSARHGPLAAMVALLVVMMIAVAFLAGGGPDADAPPVLADAADAPAEAPSAEVNEPEVASAAVPAEAEDVPPPASISPADRVQAAADDALGKALREALGPDADAAAGQAARDLPLDEPATVLHPAPEGEVAGPIEARTTEADQADPPRITDGETAVMPDPALPAPAPSVEAAPIPAGQPEGRLAMAEAQPAPPVQPEPELDSAARTSPAIVTQSMPAPADKAPVAEPADRAAVPAPARPAIRPVRPAATVRADEPAARPAPALTPAEAATGAAGRAAAAQASPRPAPRPQMARNAGQGVAPAAAPAPVTATPSSRPRAAPEGAGPARIPMATPRLGPGLDQSIRPPARPRRSGAMHGLSPGSRHFASEWAPPGSDPAAFVIPLRLAQVENLPADRAGRLAQARPQPRPGAATAIDAALQQAATAPARPAAAASAVSGGTATHGGRPARKPGAAASTVTANTAAVESAIASAIRGSTVPSAPDPSVVPGALRASALPPRRSGDAMRATAAGIVAAAPPASQPSTAATAAAAQATQDAAAEQRRRMEDELQAQAEARIRARADADSQVEARARAQAEARARAQAEAEERAARARGAQYRPAELDDEPELAALTGGTDSRIVAQNATVARGLDTNRTTLIGVVGAGKASRGLIRLRNGRIVTVRVGDRIDGGPITAIGDGGVTYTVGGRARQLKILDGR